MTKGKTFFPSTSIERFINGNNITYAELVVCCRDLAKSVKTKPDMIQYMKEAKSRLEALG